jgi:hypothetical protein
MRFDFEYHGHRKGTQPIMKAIEFETIADCHCIRLPDSIPDGTRLRVLLLIDEPPRQMADDDDLKRLLANLTQGLTDEDLHRPRNLGREDVEWGT